MTLDRILTPSSTTAAAVSSQDVSIPRNFIYWIISWFNRIFESCRRKLDRVTVI
jgi:hypothetical protein